MQWLSKQDLKLLADLSCYNLIYGNHITRYASVNSTQRPPVGGIQEERSLKFI